MTRNVLILGATSAVARAAGREWAATGARLFLVARDGERNRAVADDLRARGAVEVATHTADLADAAGHEAVLDAAFAGLPRVDRVLIAYGVLPAQATCEDDAGVLLDQLGVNATSPIALLARLGRRLADQPGDSAVAVLSSVAGDRGRRSNYAYGAAKAALSVFAAGLDARYHENGVSVSVIKLGFVSTPMTEGMTLPAPLKSAPAKVAPDILRAMDRGVPVAYVPRRWRGVMAVIRLIPGRWMRRLNF